MKGAGILRKLGMNQLRLSILLNKEPYPYLTKNPKNLYYHLQMMGNRIISIQLILALDNSRQRKVNFIKMNIFTYLISILKISCRG